jgi:dihydroxyacetone kinase-like protein
VNFRLAADQLAAEGLDVETVLVADDLSTSSDGAGAPGRRGTGAAVVVERVCGAAAARGSSLAEVAELGRRVAMNSRSLAVAMSGATHPGQDSSSFELASAEIDFGVGIHGERGTERRMIAPAAQLMADLVDPLVSDLQLSAGESVLVLVNNLGGMPCLELHLAYREVRRVLDGMGIAVPRSLVGTYVTALDMRGCSVTLTRLTPELVGLWDAPVRTPALTW